MGLVTFLLTRVSATTKYLYAGLKQFKYVYLFVFFLVSISTSFADDFNYNKAQELYKQGNYQESFKILSEGCSKNHMPSCYRVGKAYEFGKGVKQDYTKALKYYKGLCDKGEGYACTDTGYMYSKLGDSENELQYSEKACSLGYPLGCNNAGRLYLMGNGVKRDDKKGWDLLNMACDKKEARACQNLGVIYKKYGVPSLGVEKNEQKALEYEQKAKEYFKQNR